jgi:DNA-binding NtrC family response regulator
LIPLKKKGGGLRPIAVGDVLRRAAGKVLLGLPDTKRELECLKPRQCGVGMPFAAEMLGINRNTLRKKLQQHDLL